jgi:hypothetical protein
VIRSQTRGHPRNEVGGIYQVPRNHPPNCSITTVNGSTLIRGSRVSILSHDITELIHEDHHQTIHELADTDEIGYEVCQEILTENLNMHCTAMKFVPQLLTNDQKH